MYIADVMTDRHLVPPERKDSSDLSQWAIDAATDQVLSEPDRVCEFFVFNEKGCSDLLLALKGDRGAAARVLSEMKECHRQSITGRACEIEFDGA